MINFDPNNTAYPSKNDTNIEEEEDSFSDDDYEDYDMDEEIADSSWKVRRSGIKLLNTMFQTRSEIIIDISKPSFLKLLEHLKEKDENIKLDTLYALNTFVSKSTY